MNEPNLTLILPNIRSCHNVGSVFRTADGCGFEKLYLCGYTATPPKIQIDKVALGAEKWIPWEQYDDPIVCIEELKKRGVQIVALEKSDVSIPLSEYELDGPMALILGNEVDGVAEEVLALADTVVHIPMLGQKESLNVSIAAGIAMYAIQQKIV